MKYNFVEVSGHNLERSQTGDFHKQFLHFKTSFKLHLLKVGGGGGILWQSDCK